MVYLRNRVFRAIAFYRVATSKTGQNIRDFRVFLMRKSGVFRVSGAPVLMKVGYDDSKIGTNCFRTKVISVAIIFQNFFFMIFPALKV